MMETGLGGDCEGSEARWECGYTWEVVPLGGTDRSGVG